MTLWKDTAQWLQHLTEHYYKAALTLRVEYQLQPPAKTTASKRCLQLVGLSAPPDALAGNQPFPGGPALC